MFIKADSASVSDCGRRLCGGWCRSSRHRVRLRLWTRLCRLVGYKLCVYLFMGAALCRLMFAKAGSICEIIKAVSECV